MIYDVCLRPWKYFVKPFRIIDGLYYIGNKDVSSYLIYTSKGLIIFDTTFPQTVYLLLESIREIGFNPREIKYIIHSHAHYDHIGGTKSIVELTGAKTFLGMNDIFILEKRNELSWAPEYGVKFYEKFNVDYPLKNEDFIELGNVNIKCLNTPGHTPGAMSYFFEMKKGNRVFRVGTHGGPGLNTLSDEYLKKYNIPLDNRKKYLDSIKELKKEYVDIFIGIHPDQCNLSSKARKLSDEKNPFINNKEWMNFLNKLEKTAKVQFNL